MRLESLGIPAVVLALLFTCQAYGQLRIDGKKIKVSDLSPRLQSEYFEIKRQNYQLENDFWNEVLFEKHVEKLATHKGVKPEKIIADILDTTPPTEKELETFYDENKAKISYPYEAIKEDLRKYVAESKRREKKQQIIEKIKKEKGVSLSLPEPMPPQFSIQTSPFYQRGKKNSKVTLVEFADYKCPHCAEAEKVMATLFEKYQESVNFIFIDFPLRTQSESIAMAAYCSHQQGAYWKYHENLFRNQKSVNENYLLDLAKRLQLNTDKWQECRKSVAAQKIIEKGKNEGERLGVQGTPTFFLNGVRWVKGISVEAFEKAFASALNRDLKN